MASLSMPAHLRVIIRLAGRRVRHSSCVQKDNFHRCSILLANDELPKEGVRIPQTKKKSLDRSEKIGLAMKEYIEKAQLHEKMKKEMTDEYEIGKRHLANIMGIDQESFTQEDVQKAVQYLLPSGLFDRKARPIFQHPDEIMVKNKVAAISEEGRPLHFLYYTRKPQYYELLYTVSEKIEKLKEDDIKTPVSLRHPDIPLDLSSSKWITQNEFEGMFPTETVGHKDYRQFITIMDKLASLRFADKEKAFIMKYRTEVESVQDYVLPKALVDEEGRRYMTASGKRKTSTAEVTVYGDGTGIIRINEKGLDYFQDMIPREQILSPLSLTNLVGRVDIYATTQGGGIVSQSGAIRAAISQAVLPFVTSEIALKMKLAGLLSNDIRIKERKKPGQKKARKKFTWKLR